MLLSSVIYTAIFVGASQIVSIFNSERNEMLQMLAVDGLKWYFLACPFTGFNIVTVIYFTSTERPRPAQIIFFLRGLFVLVPVAFLLSSILKMTGVWLAYPISECIVAMVGTGFYILNKRK